MVEIKGGRSLKLGLNVLSKIAIFLQVNSKDENFSSFKMVSTNWMNQT